MLKKWFEIIYDHKVSLRERMFRLATGVCIVALVIILPMGRSIFNLLVLAASLICMVMTVDFDPERMYQYGSYDHHDLAPHTLPAEFFLGGWVLQRDARMVRALFYLCQHHIGGKTQDWFFPVLYGRDHALLLDGVLFSGECRQQHTGPFVL